MDRSIDSDDYLSARHGAPIHCGDLVRKSVCFFVGGEGKGKYQMTGGCTNFVYFSLEIFRTTPFEGMQTRV